MRVLISGSSGLVGTALRQQFVSRGDTVVRLVRRQPDGDNEVRWDPAAGELDCEVSRFDVVINLNGVSIGEKRWTPARKALIQSSRLAPTSLLAEAIAAASPAPVFVSASAMGVYGDHGDQELGEDVPPRPQGDFGAEVALQWEQATEPASAAGVRVVVIRSGLVFSDDGGILPRLALPFRFGVGGRIGDGTQWIGWIDIVDEVAAFVHVVEHEEISGPVNFASPQPVTNAELTKVLGRVLRRPTFLPVPRPALELLYGKELTESLLYTSLRLVPQRLTETGFEWRYPDIESSLRRALG